MCGNHASDGTPIAHEHGPIFRPRPPHRSRRAFLGDFGKGTVAAAIFTPAFLAACSSDDKSDAATALVPANPTAAPQATAAPQPTAAAQATAAPAADQSEPDEDTTVRWARANLGSVSAYVLARGNTATIVDTGVAGSADAIGSSLAALGLNYSDVAHVILTHNHPDHAGSIAEVFAQTVNATAYAGEADLGGVSMQEIVGLTGGEDVFGFEILATPGHTAGHMSVIDHTVGLLVAGDAVWTEDGGVAEGPPRFFADVPQSRDSIRRLAELSFNTLLVGHGEPIEQNADTAVADLSASLT